MFLPRPRRLVSSLRVSETPLHPWRPGWGRPWAGEPQAEGWGWGCWEAAIQGVENESQELERDRLVRSRAPGPELEPWSIYRMSTQRHEAQVATRAGRRMGSTQHVGSGCLWPRSLLCWLPPRRSHLGAPQRQQMAWEGTVGWHQQDLGLNSAV